MKCCSSKVITMTCKSNVKTVELEISFLKMRINMSLSYLLKMKTNPVDLCPTGNWRTRRSLTVLFLWSPHSPAQLYCMTPVQLQSPTYTFTIEAPPKHAYHVWVQQQSKPVLAFMHCVTTSVSQACVQESMKLCYSSRTICTGVERKSFNEQYIKIWRKKGQ